MRGPLVVRAWLPLTKTRYLQGSLLSLWHSGHQAYVWALPARAWLTGRCSQASISKHPIYADRLAGVLHSRGAFPGRLVLFPLARHLNPHSPVKWFADGSGSDLRVAPNSLILVSYKCMPDRSADLGRAHKALIPNCSELPSVVINQSLQSCLPQHLPGQQGHLKPLGSAEAEHS